MFGFKFIKVTPTIHLIQYKRGRIKQEGAGLSFFYYAPTTTLVAVPIGSTDVPFIFEEVTADFQQVTVQGHLIYKIADVQQISKLLDFSLDVTGLRYQSDDTGKLSQRVVDVIQVLTKKEIQRLNLEEATRSYEELTQRISNSLSKSQELRLLGIEVLGLSILAVKPNPETARALEAGAREELLKKADEAIYMRRNAAVEQERAIKENELDTEIAVENKKREVKEVAMASNISLEQKNRELVTLAGENSRKQSDARAYSVEVLMKSFAGVDPKVIQALTACGMSPQQMIAAAFHEIAERSEKIGQLNVSPELLRELLKERK